MMEKRWRRWRGEGEKGRRGDGIGKVKLRLPQDCLPLGRGSDSPINSMRHFLETFLEGLRAAKQVASLRRWHGSDGQLVGRTELYAVNPRIPISPVFPRISSPQTIWVQSRGKNGPTSEHSSPQLGRRILSAVSATVAMFTSGLSALELISDRHQIHHD